MQNIVHDFEDFPKNIEFANEYENYRVANQICFTANAYRNEEKYYDCIHLEFCFNMMLAQYIRQSTENKSVLSVKVQKNLPIK